MIPPGSRRWGDDDVIVLRTTGRSGGPGGSSPGHLLQLIRSRDNWTRQELLAQTGLSRTTLFERLDVLFKAGLAYEAGAARPAGGRPPSLIRFEDRGRVVLVLDLGHHSARITVTDLDGTGLRERQCAIDIGTAPGPLLDRMCRFGAEVLAEGHSEQLVGVGLAVPGPVSPTTGTLGATPVMPGWDTYPITEEIHSRWPVPVLLENDARAHALGEAAARPSASPLVTVKYAYGIGAGIVLDGSLLCGFDGAAGDIGHIRIVGTRGRRCRCGRTGCLAAYASGHAVLRTLGRHGSASVDDLTALVPVSTRAQTAVREAAGRLGETLAGIVAMVNPQMLVLGGALGRLPLVVDEVRAQIEARALDRLTERLEIVPSSAKHPAATGMAALLTGHVYSPAAVDALYST